VGRFKTQALRNVKWAKDPHNGRLTRDSSVVVLSNDKAALRLDLQPKAKADGQRRTTSGFEVVVTLVDRQSGQEQRLGVSGQTLTGETRNTLRDTFGKDLNKGRIKSTARLRDEMREERSAARGLSGDGVVSPAHLANPRADQRDEYFRYLNDAVAAINRAVASGKLTKTRARELGRIYRQKKNALEVFKTNGMLAQEIGETVTRRWLDLVPRYFAVASSSAGMPAIAIHLSDGLPGGSTLRNKGEASSAKHGLVEYINGMVDQITRITLKKGGKRPLAPKSAKGHVGANIGIDVKVSENGGLRAFLEGRIVKPKKEGPRSIEEALPILFPELFTLSKTVEDQIGPDAVKKWKRDITRDGERVDLVQMAQEKK
jgi:hypothetical protein